jgi:hypothetical protein
LPSALAGVKEKNKPALAEVEAEALFLLNVDLQQS